MRLRNWIAEQHDLRLELAMLHDRLAERTPAASESFFLGYLQGHREELQENLLWLERAAKRSLLMRALPAAMARPFVRKHCRTLVERFSLLQRMHEQERRGKKHTQGYATARLDTIRHAFAAACAFFPHCVTYADFP